MNITPIDELTPPTSALPALPASATEDEEERSSEIKNNIFLDVKCSSRLGLRSARVWGRVSAQKLRLQSCHDACLKFA